MFCLVIPLDERMESFQPKADIVEFLYNQFDFQVPLSVPDPPPELPPQRGPRQQGLRWVKELKKLKLLRLLMDQ